MFKFYAILLDRRNRKKKKKMNLCTFVWCLKKKYPQNYTMIHQLNLWNYILENDGKIKILFKPRFEKKYFARIGQDFDMDNSIINKIIKTVVSDQNILINCAEHKVPGLMSEESRSYIEDFASTFFAKCKVCKSSTGYASQNAFYWLEYESTIYNFNCEKCDIQYFVCGVCFRETIKKLLTTHRFDKECYFETDLLEVSINYDYRVEFLNEFLSNKIDVDYVKIFENPDRVVFFENGALYFSYKNSGEKKLISKVDMIWGGDFDFKYKDFEISQRDDSNLYLHNANIFWIKSHLCDGDISCGLKCKLHGILEHAVN